MRTFCHAYESLQPTLMWGATEEEQEKAAGTKIPGYFPVTTT